MEQSAKIYAELVDWNTFKIDTKAALEDNNCGYVYGLFYVDFENEGDIYECSWYKTEKERDNAIKEEGLTIINQ